MRGDQLAMQWRILRTLESKKHGVTVAELAAQEDFHPPTICSDIAAIEPAILTLLLLSDQVLLASPTRSTSKNWQFATGNGYNDYGSRGAS